MLTGKPLWEWTCILASPITDQYLLQVVNNTIYRFTKWTNLPNYVPIFKVYTLYGLTIAVTKLLHIIVVKVGNKFNLKLKFYNFIFCLSLILLFCWCYCHFFSFCYCTFEAYSIWYTQDTLFFKRLDTNNDLITYIIVYSQFFISFFFIFFEYALILFINTISYIILLDILIILKVVDYILLYIPFTSNFVNLEYIFKLSLELPLAIDLGLFIIYFTEEEILNELQDIIKQLAPETIDNFYNITTTNEHYWSINIFITYPLNHLYF
jgi:hypothetical protein